MTLDSNRSRSKIWKHWKKKIGTRIVDCSTAALMVCVQVHSPTQCTELNFFYRWSLHHSLARKGNYCMFSIVTKTAMRAHPHLHTSDDNVANYPCGVDKTNCRQLFPTCFGQILSLILFCVLFFSFWLTFPMQMTMQWSPDVPYVWGSEKKMKLSKLPREIYKKRKQIWRTEWKRTNSIKFHFFPCLASHLAQCPLLPETTENAFKNLLNCHCIRWQTNWRQIITYKRIDCCIVLLPPPPPWPLHSLKWCWFIPMEIAPIRNCRQYFRTIFDHFQRLADKTTFFFFLISRAQQRIHCIRAVVMG